jgi:hypothetical protein
VGLSLAFNGAFFACVAVLLACGVDIARVGLDAGMEANARAANGRRLPFFGPAGVLATTSATPTRAVT